MALCAYGVAGEQVHGRDHRLFTTQSGFGVLADQFTGFVVVGGEQGVGFSDRAVQGNDLHALGADFLNCGDDGVARGCDQDGFGACCDHVFHGADLAGGVAVLLARCAEQFSASGLSGRISTFFHFHEKRVAFGLGDQADHGLCGKSGGSSRSGKGDGSQCQGGGFFQAFSPRKGINQGWLIGDGFPRFLRFTFSAWWNYILVLLNKSS